GGTAGRLIFPYGTRLTNFSPDVPAPRHGGCSSLMEENGRRERSCNYIWFLACALFSSAWCIAAAFELGATFDEPLYLERGLDYWQPGSPGCLLRVGTMPLPIDLETLPIYLRERWRDQPFDLKRDAEWLLAWARLGTLAFWWLLLLYAWKAARLIA